MNGQGISSLHNTYLSERCNVLACILRELGRALDALAIWFCQLPGRLWRAEQFRALLRVFVVGILLAVALGIQLARTERDLLPGPIQAFRLALAFEQTPFYLANFLLGLGLAARFLGNLYKLENQRDADSYVMSSLFGYVARFIGFGYPAAEIREGRLFKPSLALNKIGGPGILVVDNSSAVVLERDGQHTRIVSASYVFLWPFERIRGIVDLRPQVRTKEVKTITRDGIPLKLDVEVEFCIRPGGLSEHEPGLLRRLWRCMAPWVTGLSAVVQLARFVAWLRRWRRFQRGVIDRTRPSEDEDTRRRRQRQLEQPYRFSRKAVWDAVYPLTVGKGGEVTRWADFLATLASGQVEDVLAEYRLDDLCELRPVVEGASRLEMALSQKIQVQVENEARHVLHGYGAQLLRLAMKPLEFEEKAAKVIKQRLESWQTGWVRDAHARLAQGKAERLRQVERARAEAQTTMILALAEGLRRDQPGISDNVKHVIALRTIQVLENLTLETQAYQFIPLEVLHLLTELRQLLGEAKDRPQLEMGGNNG